MLPRPEVLLWLDTGLLGTQTCSLDVNSIWQTRPTVYSRTEERGFWMQTPCLFPSSPSLRKLLKRLALLTWDLRQVGLDVVTSRKEHFNSTGAAGVFAAPTQSWVPVLAGPVVEARVPHRKSRPELWLQSATGAQQQEDDLSSLYLCSCLTT